MFIDRLIEQIQKKDNPSVVGLDPLLEYVPESIRNAAVQEYGPSAKAAAEAIFRFNRIIIDCVHDLVPAVKPQSAYYELYGTEGVACFYRTVRYAQEHGLIVIADGKRNDIGSTASAYAKAYLGKTGLWDGQEHALFDADALTVNPYLGSDGIEPFTEACKQYNKGIFVLVKTSNPSSAQLQDMVFANGKTLYEQVAELVDSWGADLIGQEGYSSVGAVVGATWPEQARKLRQVMKHAYFLVPGFGAQGGSGADAAASFDSRGLGAIVNASRSVLCAWSHKRWDGKYAQEDFGDAARAEVLRMKAELNAAIGTV